MKPYPIPSVRLVECTIQASIAYFNDSKDAYMFVINSPFIRTRTSLILVEVSLKIQLDIGNAKK
jgi:hypothetical protein